MSRSFVMRIWMPRHLVAICIAVLVSGCQLTQSGGGGHASREEQSPPARLSDDELLRFSTGLHIFERNTRDLSELEHQKMEWGGGHINPELTRMSPEEYGAMKRKEMFERIMQQINEAIEMQKQTAREELRKLQPGDPASHFER
jgi:hypothetical protein